MKSLAIARVKVNTMKATNIQRWVACTLCMVMIGLGGPGTAAADDATPVELAPRMVLPSDDLGPTVAAPEGIEAAVSTVTRSPITEDASTAVPGAPPVYAELMLLFTDEAPGAHTYTGRLCVQVSVDPPLPSGSWVGTMCEDHSPESTTWRTSEWYPLLVSSTFTATVSSNTTGCTATPDEGVVQELDAGRVFGRMVVRISCGSATEPPIVTATPTRPVTVPALVTLTPFPTGAPPMTVTAVPTITPAPSSTSGAEPSPTPTAGMTATSTIDHIPLTTTAASTVPSMTSTLAPTMAPAATSPVAILGLPSTGSGQQDDLALLSLFVTVTCLLVVAGWRFGRQR